MARLELSPISASYTFAEPAQLLHQSLPGGMPRQRLDFIGGKSRLVSITFVLDALEYEYLVRFVRQNVADDAAPIQIDLVLTDSFVVEFNATIVPDTFSLDSVDGYTFTCSMQVMAIPLDTEVPDWPAGWTAGVFQLPPDKSGYTIKYGTESLSVQHSSNVPKTRRSYFNATRIGSLKWNCKPEDYGNFFSAYRYWISVGGDPFYMDLFMDKSYLTRHRCTFIPGSVRLSSHQGNLYVVEADIEIESDPWPIAFTPHSEDISIIIPTPWDPFSSTGADSFAFTEGNFLVTSTDGSGIVFNETPWSGGFRYAEFVIGGGLSNAHTVGLKSSSGSAGNFVGLRFDGNPSVDDSPVGPDPLTVTDGSVVMVAINDIGIVFLGADGVWSGDPVAEIGGHTIPAGLISLMYNVNSAEGIFSARTRTTAAEFTYTPPTGYLPWIN